MATQNKKAPSVGKLFYCQTDFSSRCLFIRVAWRHPAYVGNATCLVDEIRKNLGKSEIILLPFSSEHRSDLACVETGLKLLLSYGARKSQSQLLSDFWKCDQSLFCRKCLFELCFSSNVWCGFLRRQIDSSTEFSFRLFWSAQSLLAFGGCHRWVCQTETVDLRSLKAEARLNFLPSLTAKCKCFSSWVDGDWNLDNHSIPSLACKVVRKFSNFLLFFSMIFLFSE